MSALVGGRSIFYHRGKGTRLWNKCFNTSSTVPAGHSKWNNIRHDKAKNDAKKSREAYALATRIETSVKNGGVAGNAQLVTLMEKARKMNVTKRIIDNAVKRGTGEIAPEGKLSEVIYEFMGPGGAAFIIEANTDNKSRTIGMVKHAMTRFNASLSPCQYMFQKKSWILFSPRSKLETLDQIFELAIDLGAEDVEQCEDPESENNSEPLYKIFTDPSQAHKMANDLSAKGYKLRDTATGYVANPDAQISLDEENQKSLKKALEHLEDIPEITNYFSNVLELPC